MRVIASLVLLLPKIMINSRILQVFVSFSFEPENLLVEFICVFELALSFQIFVGDSGDFSLVFVRISHLHGNLILVRFIQVFHIVFVFEFWLQRRGSVFDDFGWRSPSDPLLFWWLYFAMLFIIVTILLILFHYWLNSGFIKIYHQCVEWSS